MLHSNAVTKHWTANDLISRMLFSELYKIMVSKVTFAGFKGDDRPIRAPPDPPLAEQCT